MPAASAKAAPQEVRTFIEDYYGAWKATDIKRILDYYSEDVVIHLPTGTLQGRSAVRDNFVVPFVSAFPGNVHSIQNLAYGESSFVAVEWNFGAIHKGQFAGIEATGKSVRVPGCSFYEYDLNHGKITGGRVYFDFGTLLRQLSEGA